MLTITIGDFVSASGAIISVIAAIFAFYSSKQAHQLSQANFHVDASLSYEGRLCDLPEALEFYGISLEKIRADNLTLNHLTYLITYVTVFVARAKAAGVTINHYINEDDYFRYMFSFGITRKAWGYTRVFHSAKVRRQIESYLVLSDSQDTGFLEPIKAEIFTHSQ